MLDRQTTDGRATAYSEREPEFTFAKNVIGSAFYTTLYDSYAEKEIGVHALLRFNLQPMI